MSHPNPDLARYNMIEQQIRPWDVLDPQVLAVIADTPRERFAPKDKSSLAFTDTQIPLEHGQTMLEPKLEGRILQSLQIKPTDRILEIGTGTGYLTACLAKLGSEVVTVDIYPEFSQHAQQQIAGQGLDNVRFEVGDAAQNWINSGQFDAIVISGSVADISQSYKDTLNIGGRMFVVVGEGEIMEALLVTRTSQNDWSIESMFETHLPALINAEKPAAFVF